ncbi:MAG: transcription antiterminator BglG [Desulfurococcales archaeon ex4484_58]|nr:MAG: transcription antiterminator BglG [Desulfurococcales archaeon ex4484_58]
MIDVSLVLLKHRRILLDELIGLTGLNREVLLGKLKKIKEYVRIDDDEVVIVKPLDLAIHLLKQGLSVKEISRYIDWSDFEKVSAEILNAHKYFVKTNFRLTKPVKLEIDVIGVDPRSGRGLFIDCKHWSRGIHRSALVEIVDKHVNRIEKFIKYYRWARDKWVYFKYLREIIPVIITLTTPSLRYYKNTLIVSIQEFNQVLLDLYTVLDLFNIEPYRLDVK